MSEWQPIDTALENPGIEILGVQFINSRMIKEPFITFYSPTLRKFFANPTHWMPLPEPPKDKTKCKV